MNRSIFDCSGKVVLVVGGGGLLGREIVKTMKSFGADVVIAEPPVQKASALAVQTPSETLSFDITQLNRIQAVLARVRAQKGRIDVLINCAYPRTSDWGARCEDIPPSSWKKNLDDHLGGYFFTSRAAAEIMKKQKSGSIINFASIYGMVAPDFDLYRGTTMTMPAAYAAIKGGIIAFTKYLATYYGRDGVRANVVSPGGVQNHQPSAFVRRYVRKTPLGRMATPQDVVGAVVYLASDASSYVTGTNLVVDGGWTAW
jgi:NAD(P)-dependent dehydrogenase (short-subunit alcohol dehydrogenase family)